MADLSDIVQAPVSPAHVAIEAFDGWHFARHLQYVNRWLVNFHRQPGQRFGIIELPVRHGKSKMCTVAYPCWALGLDPNLEVTVVTYNNDLAETFGADAREVIGTHGERLFGVSLSKHSKAMKRFELARPFRGSMRFTSPNGTLTGLGGDVMILDDLMADPLKVERAEYRKIIWTLWTEKIRPRLGPNGKVLQVMSRWHEDDLSGRLKQATIEDPDGDQWQVLRLPAIAEPTRAERKDPGFVAAEWRDELGREIGEALWPNRWPLDTLEKTRKSMGAKGFNANFQQAPISLTGDMFPVNRWQVLEDAVPSGCKLVRFWDLAADPEGDYLAGVLVARERETAKGVPRVFVLDVVHGQGSSDEHERTMADTAESDRVEWGAVTHVVEQEPGSSGKQWAHRLVTSVLAGHDAHIKRPEAAKVIRAQSWSAQQRERNVYLLHRWMQGARLHIPADVKRSDSLAGGAGSVELVCAWRNEFVEEHRTFPKGAHDDQVDAAAGAFNWIVEWEAEQRAKRPGKSRVGKSVAQRTIG